MLVKILAVGDVCGQPGLDALDKKLKPFQKENNIAFTVVNGENADVALPQRRLRSRRHVAVRHRGARIRHYSVRSERCLSGGISKAEHPYIRR